MKLYYSGNSPYARRVRMAIRELGLLDKVQEITVDFQSGNIDDLLASGPGGKVPVLVTDAGTGLCETLVIGRYLDEMGNGALYPASGAAREYRYEIESVASVLMDSMFVRSREKNTRDAEQQSPKVLEMEAKRAARCYDRLEALAPSLGDAQDMANISVVCTLGYADWRHDDDNWREGRPALSAWYEAASSTDAAEDTKPIY